MAISSSRLDQALRDLIDSYSELEAGFVGTLGEDEDSLNHALVEVCETAIESALEENDTSTTVFASMLSNLTEALEQLDPAAFEDDDSDYEIDDVDMGVDDIDDIDDDLDLEDDEEDEEDDDD